MEILVMEHAGRCTIVTMIGFLKLQCLIFIRSDETFAVEAHVLMPCFFFRFVPSEAMVKDTIVRLKCHKKKAGVNTLKRPKKNSKIVPFIKGKYMQSPMIACRDFNAWFPI